MDFSAYGLPESMDGFVPGFSDDEPLFENGDIVDIAGVNFNHIATGKVVGRTPDCCMFDVEIEKGDGLHIERHNVCFLSLHVEGEMAANDDAA